jgi:hypothetical protein
MLSRGIALVCSVLQITFLTGIMSHSYTANRKSIWASSIRFLAFYLITLVVTIIGANSRMLVTCGCFICELVWVQFQWYTNFYENSGESGIWGSWDVLLLRVQIFWEMSLCHWLNSYQLSEGLW